MSLVLSVAARAADAAYPGTPGPIVYNAYKDVGVVEGEIEALHPHGGLFRHGPQVGDAPEQLTSEASDSDPAFSADGQLIAFTRTEVEEGAEPVPVLFVVRRDGSKAHQLTYSPFSVSDPYFSPDRKTIVFARGGHLWSIGVRGVIPKQLTFGPHRDSEPVFTPSGRRILFASDRAASGGHDSSDIWAIGADGRNPRVLINGAGAERSPEVSPDGRRIAYVVEQHRYLTGTLRVARSDGSHSRALGEPRGGTCKPCYREPAWAPDGKHLVAIEYGDNVGSSALMVMTPDGRHRRRFEDGTVSTEGRGRHLSAPTWGSRPR